MKRRSFNKLLAATGLTTLFHNGLAASFSKQSSLQLPDIVMNGNSVEICINSRYSFHGGYTATANNQVIANTLWAAASAPLMVTERIIYIAMPDALYTYKFKGGKPVLEVQASGDKRSEKNAAFELGIATNPSGAAEDAGAALHWAQLASIAFWKTKNNQVASCPKDSGRENANSSWNPISEVHCVNCYGQSSAVNGLVKTLSAVSSDKTIPDPKTDGTISLETAMKNPLFGTNFTSEDLTKEQISQILWASYGCTPHKVTGTNTMALSVASFAGNYYLTGRIYLLTSTGVQRYHMRKGPDPKTGDHRLESVKTTDSRSQLCTALPRLPQNAPVYIVYCGQSVQYQELLEAGYCGAGALLQATALGLQGHYAAQFSTAERSAIQTACGIPSTHQPMLIFSTGKAETTHTSHILRYRKQEQLNLKAAPNPFNDHITFTINNNGLHDTEIMIYTPAGRCIKTLHQTAGTFRNVYWDGTDNSGIAVRPGLYTCKITISGKEKSVVIKKL